jgi:hypothetical protein
MLYAKISPVATITKQITPFEVETITADYMTAIARPYGAGATKVNFEVVFGTITLDEAGVPASFNRLSTSNTTLLSTQLSGWGVDDSVLLTTIAVEMGTVATEFVTINTDF